MARKKIAPPPQPRSPMDELSDRLVRLARTREKPETRREVEEALLSKWEGVRANAAKVLGTWGGPASVRALRAALDACKDKHAGWALRGVLVSQLCKCVDPVEDAPWMLDCYFEAGVDGLSRAGQWEFFRFVNAVPEPILRARIQRELRSPDTGRKTAAERALNSLESRLR